MAIDLSAVASVVAGPGALLVASSPRRPKQPVADGADRVGHEFGEQVPDLVDSQRNQLVVSFRASGALVRGDDGQHRVGEHDEGRVAVPGGPFADLVLIDADLVIAGLEAFLDHLMPATRTSPARVSRWGDQQRWKASSPSLMRAGRGANGARLPRPRAG